VTALTLETYLRDAKRDEKEERKARVWDLWLDCLSEREITDAAGVPQKTVNDWLSEKRIDPEFAQPPGATRDNPWGHVQHFDIWQFATAVVFAASRPVPDQP
jgi:hypothetical protein